MRRFLLLCCTVALVGSACSSGADTVKRAATGSGKVRPASVEVPTQILGLEVRPEDVEARVKTVKRPYVDSVGMFSLRENDLLRATLQVSRFNSLARPKSATFRQEIIGLLGTSAPTLLRVGETDVYATTGNQQNVFVWFRDQGLFVLSVHQDYEFPRTLLRRVLRIEFNET